MYEMLLRSIDLAHSRQAPLSSRPLLGRGFWESRKSERSSFTLAWLYSYDVAAYAIHRQLKVALSDVRVCYLVDGLETHEELRLITADHQLFDAIRCISMNGPNPNVVPARRRSPSAISFARQVPSNLWGCVNRLTVRRTTRHLPIRSLDTSAWAISLISSTRSCGNPSITVRFSGLLASSLQQQETQPFGTCSSAYHVSIPPGAIYVAIWMSLSFSWLRASLL